jgi:hypothetical protein
MPANCAEAILVEIKRNDNERRRKVDEAKFDYQDRLKKIAKAHDEIHGRLQFKLNHAIAQEAPDHDEEEEEEEDDEDA